MSKGYGIWQRRIIEKLDEVEYFYLIDLLPENHTLAQYQVLNRAAKTLSAELTIHRYLTGKKKIIISRPEICPTR